MSESEDGANEPHTDAQTGDETETITSMDQAREAFAHVEQRRQTRSYSIPGFGDVTFTARALTSDERDDVESIASQQQSKADQRTRTGADGSDKMDIWPVKRTQLEHGIVDSSIDDFRPHREDHIRMLPTHVQEDLFMAIDDLGELDTEVRDGFQGMG